MNEIMFDKSIFGGNPLADIRDFNSDIRAAVHLINSFNKNVSWDCQCVDCQYLRTVPKVVDAMYRKLKNEY